MSVSLPRLVAAPVAVVLALLAGCVAVQPPLARTATPEPASGYIAGVYERNPGMNYGFYVTDTRTRRDHLMVFGTEASVSATSKADVSLLAVPPGRYRISSWARLGDIGKDGKAFEYARTNLEPTAELGKVFEVKAGQMVHLGGFAGTTTERRSGTTTYLTWRIDTTEVPFPEAVASVGKKYPAFAGLPVQCLYCKAATGPLEAGLGTYDPVRALAAVAEGKAANAHLRAFVGEREARLAAIEAQAAALKAKRDAEKDPIYRKGYNMQAELKVEEWSELRKKLQAEVLAEEQRVLKPIVERLKSLADPVRAAQGLQKVTSKFAQVATGADVTDVLVAQYDAKYPVAEAVAPAPAAVPAGEAK